MPQMEEEGKTDVLVFCKHANFLDILHTCWKQVKKEWRQVNEKFFESKREI